MHASSPLHLLSAYAWRNLFGIVSSVSFNPLMSLPSNRVDGDDDMTIFLTPCFLHASMTLTVPW